MKSNSIRGEVKKEEIQEDHGLGAWLSSSGELINWEGTDGRNMGIRHDLYSHL